MGTGLDSIVFSLLMFYRALTYLILIQSSWQKFVEFSGGMNSVAVMTQEMHAAQEKYGTYQVKALMSR